VTGEGYFKQIYISNNVYKISK